MNVFQQIVFKARQVEDEPAFATIDGVVTFKNLMLAVEAAGEALDLIGIRRGEIVLLDIKTQFQHISLMIAAGLRGLTTASMQTQMAVERAGVLPRYLLTDGEGVALAGATTIRVEPLWFASQRTAPDYARLLTLSGFTDPTEIVRIAFSSGTTGFPKAVAMRFAALRARVDSYQFYQGAQPGCDRLVTMLGPSILGVYYAFLGQLANGGLFALAARPVDLVHLVRTFQIGAVVLAAPQLIGVLDALEGRPPLTNVRTLLTGGSRMTATMVNEARRKITPNVMLGYASTESGMMAWASGDVLLAHEGSCGHPVLGAEVQIVDTQDRPLPAGEAGIVRVKTVEMIEYLNSTPDNEELFRDGWFYPGDLGRLSADGILSIEGRTSEVISQGRALVAPELVEEVLKDVSGVLDAGVFGVVNVSGIEEIWAALVTSRPFTHDQIVAATVEKLADKVPDRVLFIDAIPRTAMGKVKRAELRERFA